MRFVQLREWRINMRYVVYYAPIGGSNFGVVLEFSPEGSGETDTRMQVTCSSLEEQGAMLLKLDAAAFGFSTIAPAPKRAGG